MNGNNYTISISIWNGLIVITITVSPKNFTG